MKLSFLFAGAAAATAPVISLDLSEQAESVLVRRYYAKSSHPVKGNKPHPKEVPADPKIQASYGVCTAGDPRNAKHCKLPQAFAYDHHDGKKIEVKQTTHLVNVNARGSGKCVPKMKQEPINWNRRSEYIIKYNAADRAGNQAEEIYFSLVLDDPIKPILKVPRTEPVESCLAKNPFSAIGEGKWWTHPRATARDNIDGWRPVSTSRSLKFDTTKLGTYRVTFAASDKAGCYGRKHQSNIARKTVTVKVV